MDSAIDISNLIKKYLKTYDYEFDINTYMDNAKKHKL